MFDYSKKKRMEAQPPPKSLNGKLALFAVILVVFGILALAFYNLLSRHISSLQGDTRRNYYQLCCFGVIGIGILILAVQLFS